MIWLDSPNSKVQRVVAVTTSSKWRPNADQLEVLLGSLERFPVTKAVSLGEAFNVESRTVRSLAPKPPLKISGAVLNARQRLSGFTRLIPNDNPLLNSFLDRMLIADSADLTRAQRDGYATSVSDGINGQLALITMPSFRSVTFTATSDELPVSIQNRTGYPVRVVLEVKGDRVRLPNGHKVALTLDKEVTTTRLRLVARTSGSFPIIVRLTSPDGSVLLQQSQVDVRIAATSAAGLILTIGAALVLAWWWGRHTWRNRPGRYRKGSAAIEVHSD